MLRRFSQPVEYLESVLRSTLQQFEKQVAEKAKLQVMSEVVDSMMHPDDYRKEGALAALAEVEKEVSALITEDVHGYLTAQPVRAPSHEATKRIALRDVLEKVTSLKEKYTKDLPNK